jgi:hypothetical protein
VVGAPPWLAQARSGVRADGQQSVRESGLTQVPDSLQPFADRDRHRHGLGLPGEDGEFLDKVAGLGVLDVQAHDPPSQGASLKELMVRMGHSSPRAALIYLHATRERDQQIAAGMGKLFTDAKRTKTKDKGTAPKPSGTQRARGPK